MPILIDSDILIDVSRGRDEALLNRWHALGASDEVILCSPIAAAELRRGARSSEHPVLEALFASMECVPIDYEIGHTAGGYLAAYAKSHGVQIGDALIAATAAIHQAELWTRNRKHYPMRGLRFF